VKDIRACRACRDAPLYPPPLPHEPRPVFQISETARLCIVGQAPGVRAHASGRPYTDPSGVRLRSWLAGEDVFYNSQKVAIIPMGFCFPGLDGKGGDLPPRRECAEIWQARLFERLPNLELILLVGQYAQKWHLGAKAVTGGMTETVRQWRAFYDPQAHRRVIPTPHPSWRNNGWLKQNVWFEREVLPPLRDDVARLVA
jgi:uracil-DNA glycosylase